MLQEAFEGGYCYDPKKTYSGTIYQGITPPLKDKLYEDLANGVEYFTLAFGPPDAAFRAGYIQNPTDAKRAQKVIGTAAEQRVVDDAAAAIMRRLEDVARLPLAPHERARYASELASARTEMQPARMRGSLAFS
jgi:hypothetical protein